uniref:Uncharacterized protein LOC114348729 n=1 Tax=Diabrotica virgifera virgifera TaxID=50390 RepID=A0A6P7HBI7_DIAVI
SLLGFERKKLKPNTLFTSTNTVNILKVNTICIDCNIAIGSFLNGKAVHIIHQFFPQVPNGYKIVEQPLTILYYHYNGNLARVRLGQPFSDTTIEDYQYHTYQPYTSNLNYNDEIRIPIQDLDAYTLPCNSYIYIEGKMLTDDNKVPTKFQFINNGISYLFRELRYELNGVIIDSVRNIGLISTLKNYLSLNENQSKLLQNAGWFPKEDKLKLDTHGNFNVCIPLKIWSGFFEDCQKIIINMRQELVLIREKDDIDAIIATDETEKPKIEINKLYWNVPHILPNISEQLRLNKIVRSNTELPIKFRSWELIEYPTLNNSTRHTWPVKTTTKLESPRHIVVAFHDGRKGKMLKDMSKVDHCNLTNIRMFLNPLAPCVALKQRHTCLYLGGA